MQELKDITLCSIARKMWSDNSLIELLDPEIRSTTLPSHFDKIKRCIHIALLCTREDATKRPTMRQFTSMLEKNDDLPTLPTELPIAAINIATNNFSAENIVGSGGFADVYKGVLDGCEIAVKKLKNTSAEGLVEFQNEILAIAKLQHRKLVTLLGFCLDGNQKMLIYEYVANQTLHHHLFDPLKPRVLSWPERLQIIEGIVWGVLYLHEDSRLKVIHRDLKPTNILLDNNFNPKIADFSLARIVAIGRSEQITRTIVGTNGYMAPEVLKNEISTKGDVYSLGIILLEIVRGERNSRSARIEDITLCSIARKMWSDNSPIELLDPEIRSTTPPSHFDKIKRCIHIALLCTQEDATKRPTMRQVTSMLEKNDDLPTLPTELPISHISPNIESQVGSSVGELKDTEGVH